jgi:hypothetical protein
MSGTPWRKHFGAVCDTTALILFNKSNTKNHLERVVEDSHLILGGITLWILKDSRWSWNSKLTNSLPSQSHRASSRKELVLILTAISNKFQSTLVVCPQTSAHCCTTVQFTDSEL